MTRHILVLVCCAGWLAACEGGIGSFGDCPSGDCTDLTRADGGQNPLPGHEAGPGPGKLDGGSSTITTEAGTKTPPKLPDCTKDSDCKAPYVCHITGGKCVPPSARNTGSCDPIEGKNCPAGLQCISGLCVTPPGTCQNNGDCPIGYICKNGQCTWAGGGTPPCTSSSACPTGQVCVNGVCVPQAKCTVPGIADRLKGRWRLESTLHLRDGLEGFTKGLLAFSTTVSKVITGNFSISGVPSIISGLVASYLKSLIQQYVPPWAQQVITMLANVDDAIDDWKVISQETLTAVGNSQYIGESTWLRIEFEYKGIKVSNTPQNIPGLGVVTTESYTAREICGYFFMDKHKVKNAIGKIWRWAVEALITGISCSMKNVRCYTSINAMFNDLIDCAKLARAVANSTGNVIGVEAALSAACVSQKQTLVALLIKELDDLAAKMTAMSLAGKADVTNHSVLSNGKWYGTLGGAYGSGNFEGTFTGNRLP